MCLQWRNKSFRKQTCDVLGILGVTVNEATEAMGMESTDLWSVGSIPFHNRKDFVCVCSGIYTHS